MVHLILHAVALFLGSFGVYAAFKFHNESGIDNLYSLHSWVGLGAIILYGLQVILINCYHLYIQILKIAEIDMTTVLLHLLFAVVNFSNTTLRFSDTKEFSSRKRPPWAFIKILVAFMPRWGSQEF
jgi:hypothetical protein